MPGLLNREELFLLFQELERELKQRRVRGHIHVVGGAAMAFGFREARATNDIDARIVAEHDAVRDAVAAIAPRRGISEDRLKEKATVFMPERDDTADVHGLRILRTLLARFGDTQ